MPGAQVSILHFGCLVITTTSHGVIMEEGTLAQKG